LHLQEDDQRTACISHPAGSMHTLVVGTAQTL
jgi:hypothetical protein